MPFFNTVTSPVSYRGRIFVVFITLTLGLSFILAGCASTQRASYEPKRRDYQPIVDPDASASTREDGSLWAASDSINYLYSDQRAIRVGDLLTVKVEEFADAQRGSNTSLSRSSEMNADINAFLGLIQQLNDANIPVNTDNLINASASSTFNGQGTTARTEKLVATVPVLVRSVLPNGNLFVEGHRVVIVNNEEHHFYVSGVARTHDIDESNSISSARLGDAEIEFTGQGDLSQQQRQGWLARFVNWIWPF